MNKLVSVAAVAGLGAVAVAARSRRRLIAAVDPALRTPMLWAPTLVPHRAVIPAIRRLPLPTPDDMPAGATVTRQILPGADGGPPVPAMVVQPLDRPDPAPALLWIHGGGMIIGSPEQDVDRCARLAVELGAVVVAPQYRLAPEDPFPAGPDDCFSAWRWLTAADGGVAQFGLDPDRIAVGGGSAGGGLAALVAQWAVDRDAPRPCLQLLVYPMLDDRTTLRPDVGRHALLWSRHDNLIGWSCYLGHDPEWDRAPDQAVPARRADLAGLAPAWIGVGELDLFHGEDLEYARRLREAGVPCEVTEIPRAYHGFDAVAGAGPVERFHAAQVAALRRAFDAVSPSADG